ncbi:MAG: hypothetical protein FD165_867 [Gammaproteobacteria bacterium]|nr:MAG: hypothetical protein FD165_867 [Gammaproteobacteria bacterium]TND06424.1 MAG: hypothetical protein FD120_911 [Gammaproteobacteria bacterium]
MRRTPEPELMDDNAQARAYALADFDEPHARFVELLGARFSDLGGACRMLDLGCGAADIMIRVAHAYPRCCIDGVDGAGAMLRYGRNAIANAGLGQRLNLVHGYLPGVIPPATDYDAVISNSLLHHLKSPRDLWRAIAQFGRRGAAVFVMDLLRPVTREEVAALVSEYAGNEPEILRRDFFNSLCAAYRPDEVRRQLTETGLEHLTVEQASDRHLIVYGALG